MANAFGVSDGFIDKYYSKKYLL